MARKIIGQIVLFLLSMILIGASVGMVYQRWSASKGHPAVAILRAKTVEIRKRGSKAYLFTVAFKPNAADAVWAHTEVSQQAFLTNNLGHLLKIRYQDDNYQNVVLDSENWFPWITIVMFSFGVAFIYVAFTVKPKKSKKPRRLKPYAK